MAAPLDHAPAADWFPADLEGFSAAALPYGRRAQIRAERLRRPLVEIAHLSPAVGRCQGIAETNRKAILQCLLENILIIDVPARARSIRRRPGDDRVKERRREARRFGERHLAGAGNRTRFRRG